MKQARCNKDLFWAPESGEIICAGIIQNYLDWKNWGFVLFAIKTSIV